MKITLGSILFGLCFLLVSPVALADDSALTGGIGRNCHKVFADGVAEQPGPLTTWVGPLQMRVGRKVFNGTMSLLATDGFADFDFNPERENAQLAGFAKGTYDFGDDGAFHFLEVDTLTFFDQTLSTADLDGNQRTGPERDVAHSPFAPWGSGRFANADADLRVDGWIQFGVVKPDGSVVNALSYFVRGKLCDVDLR